jgi:hypothetical protein
MLEGASVMKQLICKDSKGCVQLGYVYTPSAPGYDSYLVSKTFKTNKTPIFKIHTYFMLLKSLQYGLDSYLLMYLPSI